MFINKIQVNNFRQLKDITLELQKNTTVLAGPNNSGKTSVILLLKRILSEKIFSFSELDINVYDKYIWSKHVYEIIERIHKKEIKKSEDQVNEFLSNIFSLKDEKKSEEYIIPEMLIRIQIDYLENDDISN